jgi:hypothetical protein
MNDQFESTYALLVRSKEKGRGVLEILVYAVFILGVVFSTRAVRSLPYDYDTAFCTELM